uniref:Large ribosomal subunit protein uL5c n=1 Tax=Wollemia nobilis TaxID=56998 RepID=A0A0C9S4F3_9CONI
MARMECLAGGRAITMVRVRPTSRAKAMAIPISMCSPLSVSVTRTRKVVQMVESATNSGSSGWSCMGRRALTSTTAIAFPSNSKGKGKRALFLRLRAAAAPVAVEEQQEANESRPVPRLKEMYLQEVVPKLQKEFKYRNPHEIPRVEKVVVNCGIGDAAQNAKALESAIKDISLLTGQRPVKTRAKRAIAAFKLRKGSPVGLAVTLRGQIMYNFLDRLINLALPRTRDFQGLNPNSFDGHGNYSLGIREQNVFPEIKFESMDRTRGMDVCIETTAKTDSEGQKLLSLLGMPFRD